MLFQTALPIEAQDVRLIKSEDSMVFTGLESEAIEPSAVEAIGRGKYLLIADDKAGADNNSLAIVEAATGNVIKRLQIPNRIKNPKWEGLTQDNTGNFYIVGSHFDDKSENLIARSFLYRFRLRESGSDDGAKIEIESALELNIKNSLRKQHLYDENPQTSKAKIEGLTFRRAGEKQELIIALREPSEFVSVYSAALPAAPKEKKELDLKPFFRFYAGKIQSVSFKLSSIEYVSSLNGFLVLTSTEEAGSNAFFGNTLWFVSDKMLANAKSSDDAFKRITPQIVWVFGLDMKAEGICSLPGQSGNAETVRLAIVFDNDKKDTKKPGKMQFIEVMLKK